MTMTGAAGNVDDHIFGEVQGYVEQDGDRDISPLTFAIPGATFRLA